MVSFLFFGLSRQVIAGNNAGATFSVWPDTGQTKCYDNRTAITCPAAGKPFYGQDAQYQGTKRSFTKLGAGGVEIPDTATFADGWIMTRDNFTGLIWDVKRNKDGTKNYNDPHDADNTYTWCDRDPATNGGGNGTCRDGNNTEDFIAALNQEHFGGFSDWRIPTVKELATLVDTSIPYPGPTIDTAYFPNTMSSFYWSSTTYAGYTSFAWGVGFYIGYIYYLYKGHDYYVRAVRSGQLGSVDHLVDNHDGTITDTATGLMWMKCSMGQTYNSNTNGCDGSPTKTNLQNALSNCENLTFAGHMDWRLPNRIELQSIVDYSRYDTAIDTTYFPGTMSFGYWSSTINASNTNNAWGVKFNYGHIDNYYKGHGNYVRAVRSVESGSVGDSYKLVISISGTGKVTSGDGKISCGSGTGNECSGSYTKGSSVTLTASPDSGFAFTGWGGDCDKCGNETVCTVNMDENKSCSANFGSSGGALGDVNGDGKVDIVDALFIARYAVELPVSNFNEDVADVNCNGKIDIVDALLVARKAVGLQVPAWCGN